MEKQVNYVWQGFGTLGIKPEVAGEYIHSTLKKRLGKIPTKKDIFKDAERKSSPLHKVKEFDWNKQTAYEKYNIAAAQRLLEGIQIEYIEVVGKTQIVKSRPVVINITKDSKGNIKSFGNRFGRDKLNGWKTESVEYQSAMSKPAIRNSKINEAIVMLESWEKRYNMFKTAMPHIKKAKAELKKEIKK